MVSKMQHEIRGVNVGLNMDAMVFFFLVRVCMFYLRCFDNVVLKAVGR